MKFKLNRKIIEFGEEEKEKGMGVKFGWKKKRKGIR